MLLIQQKASSCWFFVFLALAKTREGLHLLLPPLLLALSVSAWAGNLDFRYSKHSRYIDVQLIGIESKARAATLRTWITEAIESSLTHSKQLALPNALIKIQELAAQETRSRSAVPWGQTDRRTNRVQILLYVRRDASLAELRSDWTAAHELAHLYHPYLGREGRWLAEGLASYYQQKHLFRAGAHSVDAAFEKLDAGFARAQGSDNREALNDLGFANNGTMRLYWTGALFWLEVDLELRRRQSANNLDQVLDHYSQCCLVGTDSVSPDDFLRELDRLSGQSFLLAKYQNYLSGTEFPSLSASYQTLGLSRSKRGLIISGKQARLRETLMRGF